MIDVFASEPHFVDHVGAVFAALPTEQAGTFLTGSLTVRKRVQSAGFPTKPAADSTPERPVLVASAGDMVKMRRLGKGRIAIMEHGAGQSYGGRRHLPAARYGSYAGGNGRTAELFLHPGPHPAARDKAAYPRARVEVVGSPHLDTLPNREGKPDRTVAFSFHFNLAIAPETRTAYPWIFPNIAALKERFHLLGHAHPNLFDGLAPRYRRLGIEAVQEFSEVCRRADVYVCDNSSTLFAFAATGRPVVVVNPPWYDRRVNHGLRFWEAADVGVNCNRPEDLGDCIEEALRDTPAQKAKRDAALDLVYAYREGAAKRAADVLMDWAA